jgi:alcohol dehydrogenase class IV
LKGQFKNSVRDDNMLPVAAVLDAELMADVPRAVTAASGADCVCQLIEAYVTKRANPFSDAIALHFTKLAMESLRRACDDGRDMDARERMAVSACASGMAMANAGLGAAHGIAAGMGAMTPLTHGLICGVVLPHVMKLNIEKGVLKYADITRYVTGNVCADDEGAAYPAAKSEEKLNAALGIPADFRDMGVSKDDVPAIAGASMGSSMSKNPVPITRDECEALLSRLIG